MDMKTWNKKWDWIKSRIEWSVEKHPFRRNQKVFHGTVFFENHVHEAVKITKELAETQIYMDIQNAMRKEEEK